MSKTNPGNFFEDFELGQVIEHATPRTITEGDRAVYGALYPTRFAIPTSGSHLAGNAHTPTPNSALVGQIRYSPDGSTLYAALNGQNAVVALDPGAKLGEVHWHHRRMLVSLPLLHASRGARQRVLGRLFGKPLRACFGCSGLSCLYGGSLCRVLSTPGAIQSIHGTPFPCYRKPGH